MITDEIQNKINNREKFIFKSAELPNLRADSLYFIFE